MSPNDVDVELLLEYLRRHITWEQIQRIAKRPARAVRRELALLDFGFFCKYYLQTYFNKPFARIHEETIADVEAMTRDPSGGANQGPDGSGLAVAWPRGHGKTTTVSFALPIWAAITGQKHFIPVIMDSYDQAKLVLQSIKDEIENNQRLREDFGELQGPTWQEDTVILLGAGGVDCMILALGVRMKLRGRKYKQWRPDLIICDDLENDENVESPTQRAKLRRWFFRAVMKAGDASTDIVVPGTVIHYDCLLTHLLKHPLFKARKYQAVVSWATRGDLWGEWERVFTDLANDNRVEDARRFFEQRRPEMLEGTQVAWPEKVPYYALMVMRMEPQSEESGIAIASFSAEMQNEPVAEGERTFQRLQYWHYETRQNELWLVPDERGQATRLADCRVFSACDPSMGRGQTSDFSAIIDLAVAPWRQEFVLEADIERRHPDRLIEVILDHNARWRPVQFGIESNGFQAMVHSDTASAALARGEYPALVEIPSKGDKGVRIRSLQPDVANGYILFNREHRRLNAQMTNHPAADHDDGPDALEMVRTLARAYAGKRPLPARAGVSGRRTGRG